MKILTFRVRSIRGTLWQGDISDKVFNLLKKVKYFAVDLEFKTESRDKFVLETTKMAAIQIYSPGYGVHVVRVNNGERPVKLLQLLGMKKIIKIFHYAYGDCQHIFYQWGVLVQNIACTKEAARHLYWNKGCSSSLQPLLENELKIKVSKSEQMSDWFALHLNCKQVAYAARDVIYLPALLDVLKRKLKDIDRLDTTRLEWQALPSLVYGTVTGLFKEYGVFNHSIAEYVQFVS